MWNTTVIECFVHTKICECVYNLFVGLLDEKCFYKFIDLFLRNFHRRAMRVECLWHIVNRNLCALSLTVRLPFP